MVNEPHFEKFEHLQFTIEENDIKRIIRIEMDMRSIQVKKPFWHINNKKIKRNNKIDK